MNFIFSHHALEELELRSISKHIVEEVLNTPQEIVDNEYDKKVYQSVLEFENGKKYLLRIIIATDKQPPVVVTLYRTSKISKYLKKP